MLKRLQTCDKKSAPQEFHRRRVTKVKWEFLRWIFVKVRNVKIHWENVYFMRMSENEKKRVRRRVVFYWRDLVCTDIIYKVLLQLKKLSESLPMTQHPSGCMSPRQGHQNRHRAHQWSLFMKFSTFFGSCSRPFPAKISGQIDRLDTLPIPLDRFWPKEGSDKVLSNSVVWASRSPHVKGAKNTNNILHWKIEFPLPTYYSLSWRSFPSHLMKSDRWWAPSRLVSRSKLSTFVTAGVTRKASLTLNDS